MNAINHAATALLINKKWPGVPIIPVLISVQLVEFLWVVFNLLGIETTTTGAQVAVMFLFNLAALSFYSPLILGPEHVLAGHPDIFATIIGVHVILGLLAVGFFAHSHWRRNPNEAQQGGPVDRPNAAGR